MSDWDKIADREIQKIIDEAQKNGETLSINELVKRAAAKGVTVELKSAK